MAETRASKPTEVYHQYMKSTEKKNDDQAKLLDRGRYVLVSPEPIAKGGSSMVFQGRDSHQQNALRAIKKLYAFGTPEEIKQIKSDFQQEYQLLKKLQHRYLAKTYDDGYFEQEGQPHFVMEFINGQTLKAHLEAAGGQLALGEVIQIAIQLCDVLDYLHTQQPPIIFRDLKPSNVMIKPDKSICLIDLGIARHFKQDQPQDTVAMGTLGYAAPEQYTKATPRSDIYSLGVMLHHLLSGLDPSEHFVLPPFDPMKQSGPASQELALLIEQMIQTDQKKRPQDVQTILKKLQELEKRLSPQSQKETLSITETESKSRSASRNLFLEIRTDQL